MVLGDAAIMGAGLQDCREAKQSELTDDSKRMHLKVVRAPYQYGQGVEEVYFTCKTGHLLLTS